jgi:hypothetical protein
MKQFEEDRVSHFVDTFRAVRGCALVVSSLVALACGTSAEPPSGAAGAGGSGGIAASGGNHGAGTAGVGGSTGGTGTGGASGGSTAHAGANAGGASAMGSGGSHGGTGPSGGSGALGGAGAQGGAPNPSSGGASGTAATGGATAGGAGTTGGAGGSSGTAGSAAGGSGGLPPVSDVENSGADCPLPTLPDVNGLTTTVASLPDPFQMASGSRMMSRADWRCRRAEIGAMIQKYETGTKPAPPTNLTATYTGGKLSVTVTEGSNSLTLTTTITTPSGNGPFPAVIGMDTGGTGALPSSIFTSRGIATMTFTSSQLTPQSPSRGEGAIYKLYPDPKVGSMILWAWGVSRIIDGLQKTAAQNNIDMKHIAVTGCSYAGKMALYAGAFDERIALVIPEESGGGGEAAWRVSATKTGTEDLEHAQGTSWYYQDLMHFTNSNVGTLPFDQHELAALVAPRAILTIGNPDIDYLSTEAGYVSMKAATEVYKALGIPERIGFSQVGGHSHCAFPSSQTDDVSAFVDKFLVGKADANTSIAKSPYNTDLTKWITWMTPALN